MVIRRAVEGVPWRNGRGHPIQIHRKKNAFEVQLGGKWAFNLLVELYWECSVALSHKRELVERAKVG
jgi:hypothetical protein